MPATRVLPTKTDTFNGRFVKLVPNEQVVEVVEFETIDPAMRGEMTITITLADAEGGTDIHAVHDGLPSGLSPTDNEVGWRMSLDKLAALVETGSEPPGNGPGQLIAAHRPRAAHEHPLLHRQRERFRSDVASSVKRLGWDGSLY